VTNAPASQYRPARPQSRGHEFGNRRDRTAVFHEFAEQGAEQEDREELRDKSRPAVHKGLRPKGKQRPACESGGH
jgi:hypothetical protein